MSKPVRTTRAADEHILELDAWWRAHRVEAPDAFQQELATSFRTLSAVPGLGKRYPHSSPGVRRILMGTTRHHIYYVERDEDVLVLAIWGATKGDGPDLADPSTKAPA